MAIKFCRLMRILAPVTAPRGDAMVLKTPSGKSCLNKRIDDVIGTEQYGLICRVGTVACDK